jgi:pyruvate,water dikinase
MWQENYRRIGYRIPLDIEIISVFHGRLYFNITFMQQIAAELGAHPSFLSRYIGGPAEWSPQSSRTPFIWKAVLKKLPIILRIMRLYRRLPVLASNLFAELKDRAMRDKELKIEDMSDKEIIRYFEELEDYLQKRDITLAIVSAATSSYSMLEWIMRKWVGIKNQDLISNLLTGLGNIESTQQILKLMGLARIAREEPEARNFFLDPDYYPSEYQDKLAGTAFLKDFMAYLDEFGHRGIYETDTMYPRFAEDPSYLLNVIRSYVEVQSIPDPEEVLHQQEKIREEAFLQVKEVLVKQGFPRRWLRYRFFHRTYQDLCTAIIMREKNRYHIMMPLYMIRKMHLELGKRFNQRRIIQQPQDIFFLTVEEIRGILHERSEFTSPQRLGARIGERKEEWEANAQVLVPDLIWGEISSAELEPPITTKTEGLKVFHGIGLSPGVATGSAKVSSLPAEKSLKAGEILVAPVIDPSWAPLFGLAGGLIVELGGLLSHGSIIAREYGIPAVSNVSGITKALKDGMLITVDGNKGEVRIEWLKAYC